MNGRAHRTGAAFAAALAVATDECRRCQKALSDPYSTAAERQFNLGKVLCGAPLGHALGTLPDILEPASNPNHRQFFHSITFALLILLASVKIWAWDPDEPWQKTVRLVGLIASASYLVHLLMDATTPRSLPLL